MVYEIHSPSPHLLMGQEYEILGQLSRRALDSSWCAASSLSIRSNLRSVVSVQFLVILRSAHLGLEMKEKSTVTVCFDMHLLDSCYGLLEMIHQWCEEGRRKKEALE